MDRKKSLLNVTVSVIMKILTIGMSIFVKRQLILCCGNEVNGLNALYLSIIGFLAVAELGVGSAITFSMYKPIVEGNVNQVSALYHLFERVYLIIGILIMVAGVALTPFLHYFAKDYTQINVNLYITFLLMLISVVLTYMYSSKLALLNAHKNDYISTVISQSGVILQYILQMSVLLIVGTFESYLICRIVACLFQWIATEVVVRKTYPYILSNRQHIDVATRKKLGANIKAMFMHKVGYVLVNTVDSVVIAAFVGVVVLGEYSNYTTILAALAGVLKLVFTSLTSVFGHLYTQKDRKITRDYCEAFHFLNFAIGVVFFLGYYAIADNLIAILFAEELMIAKSITMTITINGFVQFMRENTLVFRDATGTFYNDRWKPLFEGLFNVTFSILFVRQFGVVGVIVATIATNLLICHVVEPYVVYKFAFLESPMRFYQKNYLYIAIFIVSVFVMDRCMMDMAHPWIELLTNGVISACFSVVICLAMLPLNKGVLCRLFKKRST